MAVWLMVWGHNKFDNLEQTAKVLDNQKIDIPLDLTFLSKVKHDELGENVELDFIYNDNLWELTISDDIIILKYLLTNKAKRLYNDSRVWEFGVSFYKDIISFSGSFRHFSSWCDIISDKMLRDGWSKVIQTIFAYFGVENIIYFTEWGFGYEDVEKFNEIDDWIKLNPQNIVSDLSKIDDYNKIFIQKLDIIH